MPTPQVTTLKVVEGESTVVVRVNLLSDGSGELINVPFFSPSDLVPPRPNNRPTFRIDQIWYAMVWFDVTISVDALQPVPLWTLAKDCDSHIDFRSFGGLIDPNAYLSPPSLDSGVLLLSTNNFTAVGSQGTLVIAMTKLNAPR